MGLNAEESLTLGCLVSGALYVILIAALYIGVVVAVIYALYALSMFLLGSP